MSKICLLYYPIFPRIPDFQEVCVDFFKGNVELGIGVITDWAPPLLTPQPLEKKLPER